MDQLTAFGNQLLAVHGWLREQLGRLRDAAEDGTAVDTSDLDLRAHCFAFCAALEDHHRLEDTSVFLAVVAEYPELESVVAELMRDHEQIAALLRQVRIVADALADEPSPEELRRLRNELDGLAALAESHFTYEERKLVAALDQLTGGDLAPFADPALADHVRQNNSRG
ncbi:Hemerythrin HHE cation binding domain protein [Catenulispora acidiphila DSM 44928]|uniref:Hemerythrin HHE cation binding domain protein n=1 Tax=Catenulispora acidiphila (strain DSM 44928 / JCM 14897 / NBRC 102108 / NRRL B-24433 / ID139908) TaxID=479433 RepID=C7Q8N3_CATAD|nr:hemerythrin domain-containing protein [Catenulispora acidiphila]ACU70298.1 Hemerythrin HHE cation binding domain protein [Catenulispora acidiphila DSM 44928]